MKERIRKVLSSIWFYAIATVVLLLVLYLLPIRTDVKEIILGIFFLSLAAGGIVDIPLKIWARRERTNVFDLTAKFFLSLLPASIVVGHFIKAGDGWTGVIDYSSYGCLGLAAASYVLQIIFPDVSVKASKYYVNEFFKDVFTVMPVSPNGLSAEKLMNLFDRPEALMAFRDEVFGTQNICLGRSIHLLETKSKIEGRILKRKRLSASDFDGISQQEQASFWKEVDARLQRAYPQSRKG